MTKFEAAVLEETRRVRSILQARDMSRFQFTITASGRVQDGEVLVTFGIGEYGETVKGNSIDGVLAEYARRKGWEDRNDGLALPNYSETPDVPAAPESNSSLKDEIPF